MKGYRAKNGGPYGYAVTVILKDGRTFQTGGARASGRPPARRTSISSARHTNATEHPTEKGFV